MTEQTQVGQLAAVLKDLAALTERQTAELAELAGRMDALEERLTAAQTMQSQSAERIERLATELDVSAAMASLGEQLGALRAAGAEAAARLESLASDVTRISRIDASLGHLRDDMTAKADSMDRALRGDLVLARQSQERASAELGRQVHALQQELESARSLSDRVTALDRRQTEADAVSERLAARFEELGALRQEVGEALKRSDLHLEARVAGLAESLDSLSAEVTSWRGRLDVHAETVREARGIADAMRAEAERLATLQHAAAEGQRLFEDRVQGALGDLGAAVDRAWEQFRQTQERQWSALNDANAERDRAQASGESSLAGLGERLQAMERDLAREIDARSAALQALRADIAAAFASWRDAAALSIDGIEAALPRGEKSTLASERREAVRLALKARRDRPQS